MKYRVLTHHYGHHSDPNYKDNMEFCCKIAGEFEEDWWTQPDSDEWDYDNHIWYFKDKEVAMLFKVFSGGRNLKTIEIH